jgi:hypothetical protein
MARSSYNQRPFVARCQECQGIAALWDKTLGRIHHIDFYASPSKQPPKSRSKWAVDPKYYPNGPEW